MKEHVNILNDEEDLNPYQTSTVRNYSWRSMLHTHDCSIATLPSLPAWSISVSGAVAGEDEFCSLRLLFSV